MAGTISSQDDNFILHDKELPFKLAFWRYMHITQTVSFQEPSKICTNIFCKGNTQHRYHMPITKLKEKQFDLLRWGYGLEGAVTRAYRYAQR